MKKTLKLLPLVLLVSAVARADGDKMPSTEEALVVHLEGAKWKPAPKPNEAVMVSPIAVDPASKASLGYAKFPAGYKFPAHFHTHAEYSVLISGKAVFTIDGKEHAMEPGSYVTIPGKTKHALTCGEGAECVLLTRRPGLADYHWVTP